MCLGHHPHVIGGEPHSNRADWVNTPNQSLDQQWRHNKKRKLLQIFHRILIHSTLPQTLLNYYSSETSSTASGTAPHHTTFPKTGPTPSDYTITAPPLPNRCTTTAQPLLHRYQIVSGILLNYHPTTFQLPPNYFPTTSQLLPNYFLTTAQLLPNYSTSPEITQILPSTALATIATRH